MEGDRMNKKIKGILAVLVTLMLCQSAPILGHAESKSKKKEPLITELKYDEERKVLVGKTAPNANIYLDNVASSIVASDSGDFEVPIPKGTKKSIVFVLDAEGNDSTDVNYDFEKNTMESHKEESQDEGEKETKDSDAKDEKEEDKKENTEKVPDTSDAKQEAGALNTDVSGELDSTQSDTSTSINTQESPTKEVKRSLVWLWTLLSIIGVAVVALVAWLLHKKKVAKEEQEAARKKKKKSRQKSERDPDDVFEEITTSTSVKKAPGSKQISSAKKKKKKSHEGSTGHKKKEQSNKKVSDSSSHKGTKTGNKKKRKKK